MLIQLWDTRDGEFVRSLKGHTGEVLKLGYSRDELFLVSCGSETIIMVSLFVHVYGLVYCCVSLHLIHLSQQTAYFCYLCLHFQLLLLCSIQCVTEVSVFWLSSFFDAYDVYVFMFYLLLCFVICVCDYCPCLWSLYGRCGISLPTPSSAG